MANDFKPGATYAQIVAISGGGGLHYMDILVHADGVVPDALQNARVLTRTLNAVPGRFGFEQFAISGDDGTMNYPTGLYVSRDTIFTASGKWAFVVLVATQFLQDEVIESEDGAHKIAMKAGQYLIRDLSDQLRAVDATLFDTGFKLLTDVEKELRGKRVVMPPYIAAQVGAA